MCGPLSMICLNLMNHRVRCSNLWAFSGPFQTYPCDQELELINRTKEGREVTYHLTESGKEILNSED